MMSVNLNDIVISRISGADYLCIISKSDALNLLKSADSNKKEVQ